MPPRGLSGRCAAHGLADRGRALDDRHAPGFGYVVERRDLYRPDEAHGALYDPDRLDQARYEDGASEPRPPEHRAIRRPPPRAVNHLRVVIQRVSHSGLD